MVDQYYYSGCVPEDNSTYVKRKADEELYEALKAGKFCYVLNSSQSGKSSLRIRTVRRLRDDGIECAVIDLSGGTSKNISEEEWYKGLVEKLIDYFDLDFKFAEWWERNQSDSGGTRFRKFIEKILLAQIDENIVIFIDEIGSVVSLNFNTDDFFVFIRYCHERRNDERKYKRLTFCLLGIASPSDLIKDKNITAFNIGKGIFLKPFQSNDKIEPLIKGLQGIYPDPEGIFKQILDWTGGQPFLTQKLCDLMVKESQEENPRNVEQVVRQCIIENWEAQDYPQHLQTIRDRIIKNKNAPALIGLCQRICQAEKFEIIADDTPEQYHLQLSGLVVKEKNKLRVYNPIYKEIFDNDWIETQLQTFCPYAENLKAWVASEYKDTSRLLRGVTLLDGQKWSKDKSLSDRHTMFLLASQQEEQKLARLEIEAALEREKQDKEAAEQRSQVLAEANYTLAVANKKAKSRTRVGNIILVALLISASLAGVKLNRVQNQLTNISLLSELIPQIQRKDEQEAAEATKQLGLSQDEEIKENYNLQQSLLLSNIALAYQNLEQREDAIKTIKKNTKLLGDGNSQISPLEKEVRLYSLIIQGKIYKEQENNQAALEFYKKAFGLLQSNTQQFNPHNSKNKIITPDTIKSLHYELIELLTPNQNNDLLSKVKQSQQEYFYAELKNLLQNNKLKEADNLTAEIVWELSNTSQERRFPAEVAQNFPCQDLRAMDELWTNSDRRFGFSVQKRIWREVNGDIIEFMSRVGWARLETDADGNRTLVFLPTTDFSGDALKEGQLPWLVTWEGSDGTRDRTAYLNRISECLSENR
ncbi:AAA-like domain-containing protein [Chlorogloea sp. CCALA 695]|uniref:AAA-like domain-containing protein n=1 Tax=Chlorogloea sp. CCALA 695 TaxID=2107693 RepID=UPI000D0509DF|nr:AAA-like domain-containing protein [Chlorogloea sp. CCALA 695]PSB32983.1 hypothetical protein C7B70_08195 [Chlorogloea sp. CCALA 695]